MVAKFTAAAAPALSIPQVDTSWLGQLTNGLAQSTQSNGAFPPAPSSSGFPPAPAAPAGFLQRLIGQVPTNQLATNPMLSAATPRLGG